MMKKTDKNCCFDLILGQKFNKRFLIMSSLLIGGGMTTHGFASGLTNHGKVEVVSLMKTKGLQQTPIKGVVKDAATGQGLTGVSVKIKGSSNGTSTDENGAFTIQGKIGDVLIVSYIGYKSTEVAVSSKADLTISLSGSEDALEEVVVTGYSTQRKKDLTGSVAVVNTDQLKTTPAASAVESLQGRATGVQVVTDGAPGATPAIKIRGYSTINNNEPLYVIDGVPYEGKLSWLNQNDIESMQVLKDASAASIYGSRANNGVIIITTKSGKSGKPQINLDTYYGVQVPNSSRFPKMLDPLQVYRINGNTGDLPVYLRYGSLSGNEIDPKNVDMSKYNYADNKEEFFQITKANQAGTDWFKELSQNAPTQSYQLSAVGGGENASYAVSGGYLGQKGTVIHTGFERFNVRSNTNFSAFNKKLRFGENMQYSMTKGHGIGVNTNTAGDYIGEGSALGFAYRIKNIIPVYDEGGNFAGSIGGWGNGENPVAIAYRAKDDVNRSNLFFGNAFGEYDILKGLTFRTSFGIKYENYYGVDYTYPNLEFQEGSANNGIAETAGYNTEWTWTNTLNYKVNFNDVHNLNILLGTEAIDNSHRQVRGTDNDFFITNNLDYFYVGSGSKKSGASEGAYGSLFSLFGKVDYSYKDRYILSATVRRDGSSNFGPNNKYGVFPGASAAWRLSQEDFMKNISWLNDLKIRAGYGITGNQRIPGYQYLKRFQLSQNSSSYPIGGSLVSGMWISDYQNENVKWEQVKSLNLGLDFSILEGKIDGTFDWYNKKTTDMLFALPLPATAVGRGNSPYLNVGDMQNKGVELSLNYHHKQHDPNKFDFDLGVNFSKNDNKILSLAPGVEQVVYGAFRSMETSIMKAGSPFGAFYGFKVAGIYQNSGELTQYASYDLARVGGFRFEDINNDGKIDESDKTIIGSPHPDFTYAINFNARYQNFDMMMYFYGSKGNQNYEATRYFTDFGVFDGQKSTRLLDMWSTENPSGSVPSITKDKVSPNEYASSTYYIQDASFFKMKNFQIGYNFQTDKLFGSNTGVKRLRAYLGVTNLFTITKYKGLDPEVTATPSKYPALGVDFGVYPQSRQYMLGVSVGF
ncbi:TonB-dependent receptor [Sphingobacterium sp. Lzh-3]|uniref:SusC/RagA family TonB-linked outer membrane protein n=1 Tax=unclassified Sphingobacterium TaxID=2609468 RepID=UPI002955ADA6|nr:TonB-dependent receptor [Sphingobacterium sp. UGAL515B_05]WON97200.1 TonB-dependent receptor [Sphingobacterium sp. UGAL515B_05]